MIFLKTGVKKDQIYRFLSHPMYTYIFIYIYGLRRALFTGHSLGCILCCQPLHVYMYMHMLRDMPGLREPMVLSALNL
jgi:protein-S-isoprenylcysteine O-methyltransferase Ste14